MPASAATLAARLRGGTRALSGIGLGLVWEPSSPCRSPCEVPGPVSPHSPGPAAAAAGAPRGAARGLQQQQQVQGAAAADASGSSGSAGFWPPTCCGGRAAGLRSGRLERMCSMEKGQGRPGSLRLAALPAVDMLAGRRREQPK